VPVIIVTREKYSYVSGAEDFAGKTIAMVKGYFVSEQLIAEYPEIVPKWVETPQQALNLVSTGSADAFVSNLAVATFLIDKNNLSNLKIAAPADIPNLELRFGVRKGLEPAVKIINEALASIDQNKHREIRQRWVGLKVGNLIDYRLLIQIGVAFLIVVIIGTAWLMQMRRQTKRIQVSQAVVAEKEKLLSLALNNMTDGMYMLDKEMRYILFNERYIKIAEMDDSLIKIGAPMEKVVQTHAERGDYGEGDVVEIVKTRMEALASEEIIDAELAIEDGQSVIDVRKAPLQDGGAIVTISDVTERKQAEKMMQEAFSVISSSIDYASNIQRSVLPDSTLFSSLLSDYFVLWEPRDVVGGDIYWCRLWGDGFLIVLGDCTGHGVPGAFMTLIATGALDNALNDVVPGSVGDLMQRIHQIVQITLGQHGEGGQSDDGMELGMCYLGPEMDELTFVGARFELYLLENDTISIIKGTKSGIGYRGISHTQKYEEHQIINLENKIFFMTSDGLIDQVGGERRLMFGKRRFKELLLNLKDRPLADYKHPILEKLLEYQGEQKRRDDVSVIGFKV